MKSAQTHFDSSDAKLQGVPFYSWLTEQMAMGMFWGAV